ncbi:hypothetical protein SAMD00019534_089470 [Acytostelium subglobosum LB1]|uniref:hypothetical protein n=1 Tax=Acytostelium subglobosum LB1 TaxID=1410327 RepID=UPI0006448EB1|nr:hypothetical protein SAMD00019534_089470 [Acytostelium subglobosum LB1]GAM25772.1 hypothetical protein SAMD00019534_089470 [Acytostelium subglobosum LB1]|eukprot:XP_012751290.1 hypothetical protein SAMD00019534_089470 [Acytostelium subglobosum LB1]
MEDYFNPASYAHLFKHSLSESDWSELFNLDFKFVMGKTPLSQFQILPIVIGIYLFTIFSIKFLMRNREAFELKSASVIHNFILCVWSLAMCAGVVYECYKRIMGEGPLFTLCETAAGYNQGPSYYWSYIFYLSKFYELFDTVIIVLKKKPLIFLHVYHHCIVVWLCWYFLYTGWSLQLWVVFLNTFVHVFMYYFYLNCALGIQVWWKKYITMIQIIQFCCFALVGILHLGLINTVGCQTHYSAFASAYLINFSFLFLFTQFFKRSYDTKGKVAGSSANNSRTKPIKSE